MSKNAELVDSAQTPKSTKDVQIVREALQRLRKLRSNLPPVDAVSIIREMRESGAREIDADRS